jgi:hypothetical protein
MVHYVRPAAMETLEMQRGTGARVWIPDRLVQMLSRKEYEELKRVQTGTRLNIAGSGDLHSNPGTAVSCSACKLPQVQKGLAR